MLGHNVIRRKKKKRGKISAKEYVEIIETIRRAPAELSNEDIRDQVTKIYGTPQPLITSPTSFSAYASQIIVTVFIVLLFIFTISFVTGKQSNNVKDEGLPLTTPSNDIIF